MNGSVQDRLTALQALPLVFIGGMPRSGTTWVQQLLNAHPQILGMGETQFVSRLAPALIGVLDRYTNTRDEASAVWAPSHGEISDVAKQRVLRSAFYEIALDATADTDLAHISLLGEKTPENTNHLPLLRQLFPGFKYVHVVRDCRDGVFSAWYRFRSKLPASMTLTEYAAVYADEWVKRNQMVERDADPGRTIRVRYEDLHANIDDQAARLFSFLDVSTDLADIRVAVDQSAFKVLSKGRDIGEVEQTSHYRRGEVGGWADEADQQVVDIVVDRAGDLMTAYGYEVGR